MSGNEQVATLNPGRGARKPWSRVHQFLKSPPGLATTFLLGVLVSVVAGGLGDRVVAAARPTAAVLSIEIGGHPDTPIVQVSSETADKERNSYFLPSLDTAMDSNAARSYLEVAEERVKKIRAAVAFLAEVKSWSHWQTGDLESTRKRFLAEWTAVSNNVTILERVANHVIRFERERFAEKYAKHPEGWQSKSIVIDANRKFNLGEVTAEPSMTISDREQVNGQNIFRRMLIGMDYDDIQFMIQRMHSFYSEHLANSVAVVDDIRRHLDTIKTHRYLMVDVLITNDGDRAVCIDHTSILEFWGIIDGRNGVHSVEMAIYANDGIMKRPLKVAGGESLILSLVSTKPVGEAVFFRADDSQVKPDAVVLDTFLANAVGEIRALFCMVGFSEGVGTSSLATDKVQMAPNIAARRIERLRKGSG